MPSPLGDGQIDTPMNRHNRGEVKLPFTHSPVLVVRVLECWSSPPNPTMKTLDPLIFPRFRKRVPERVVDARGVCIFHTSLTDLAYTTKRLVDFHSGLEMPWRTPAHELLSNQ